MRRGQPVLATWPGGFGASLNSRPRHPASVVTWCFLPLLRLVSRLQRSRLASRAGRAGPLQVVLAALRAFRSACWSCTGCF